MRFVKQQFERRRGRATPPAGNPHPPDLRHHFPGVPKHTDPRHVCAELATKARAAQVKARHEALGARAQEGAMRPGSRSAQ